jgi:predicted CoA-binding protein
MPAPVAVDHDAAVIGASPEPWRPSFGVMRYLHGPGIG